MKQEIKGINCEVKNCIHHDMSNCCTAGSINELRAMVNLKPKKYSELTTDQLTVLRNKVLFKLENEVMFHPTLSVSSGYQST